MARDIRFHALSGLAAAAVALCMLTIGTVASTPYMEPVRQGGMTVIYKNGDTPVWMAIALTRAEKGIWL